jgi:hypothetical protein
MLVELEFFGSTQASLQGLIRGFLAWLFVLGADALIFGDHMTLALVLRAILLASALTVLRPGASRKTALVYGALVGFTLYGFSPSCGLTQVAARAAVCALIVWFIYQCTASSSSASSSSSGSGDSDSGASRGCWLAEGDLASADRGDDCSGARKRRGVSS